MQNERAYENKTGCNGHSCSDCYQYSHQHSTCWWLRDPCTDDSRCAYIVRYDGNNVYVGVSSIRQVRPAVYIKE